MAAVVLLPRKAVVEVPVVKAVLLTVTVPAEVVRPPEEVIAPTVVRFPAEVKVLSTVQAPPFIEPVHRRSSRDEWHDRPKRRNDRAGQLLGV